MIVIIRPATEDDARDLAPRLREADAEEVWATSLKTPEQALLSSVRMSTHAWSGFVDGNLVCMWGCGPASMLDRIGVPWMLGSDDVLKHQKAFLRRNREYVQEMLSCYTRLVNWVDARNTVSIHWLRWLGFEIGEALPHGALNMPFHRFEMGA